MASRLLRGAAAVKEGMYPGQRKGWEAGSACMSVNVCVGGGAWGAPQHSGDIYHTRASPCSRAPGLRGKGLRP